MSAAPSNEEEQLKLLGFEFPKDFPWYKFYECYYNLLDGISKANGMDKTWSQFQPKMRASLDDWRECVKSGDESTVYAYEYLTFRLLYDLCLWTNFP